MSIIESGQRCHVHIGEQIDDVSIVLADGTDMVKRIPITRLELTISGPSQPPELVVHIDRPELSAEDIRWLIPEKELRWLAEIHGYRLVAVRVRRE